MMLIKAGKQQAVHNHERSRADIVHLVCTAHLVAILV